ncbi:MAG: HEAT repeat domain-containing protein [Desulfovibrionales bacterium]|nr:HEAT repeat domain-containing protein [Desulfovibrionales bacterium]
MHEDDRNRLETSLAMLSDREGLVRQKGRRILEDMGALAVPELSRVLGDSLSKDARWGAAKALGNIGDPAAIPALLDALEDHDADVAWLAAVALNKLGKAAWKPVLHRLVERGVDSVAVRAGVHHILTGQKFGSYEELFATLMQSLEMGELDEAGSMTATEILTRMLNGLWQECRALNTKEEQE